MVVVPCRQSLGSTFVLLHSEPLNFNENPGLSFRYREILQV